MPHPTSLLHDAYFVTHFRCPELPESWPDEFAVITAYATTGESWTAEENEEADRHLKEALEATALSPIRITGYSPDTGHSEPGWAVALPLEAACDLGVQFKQDAIYWVSGNQLSVTLCDDRRALVPVDTFRNRVSVESSKIQE
ncbi:MAG: DUF3293 domain-containing protein [Verrucomicrobiales bacterium]|jgi:hypothetical protein|nr:DUF3293 domain-containing protein [Verrucomicrobiales bacterium]MBP9225117.1 DUF3293 domain-containing protein [Verrucomicrobiales bacterium]HQZ29952.1 DUF3293 domain-containing protein [Verrucomicrobiales bacterium]